MTVFELNKKQSETDFIVEIEVVFRYDKNSEEVVAFFNDYNKDTNQITCYSHSEQHCSAVLDYYDDTVRATKEQYNSLLRELEEIGYSIILKNKIRRR